MNWLACRSSCVTLWDVKARAFLLALPEERVPVQSLAWSPHGERLAVGLFDGSLAIWDVPRVREQLAGLGLAW
jgi:WD40 repeat protein